MNALTVKEIAAMINRDKRSVLWQIRIGRLKAEKESSHPRSPYIIAEKDFSQFLCKTPSARNDFARYLCCYIKENGDVSPQLRVINEHVLANVNNYTYSACELAEMFDVTRRTIYNWTEKGYLEEDAGPRLYSRQSVLRLANTHPKFHKFTLKGGIPV